VKAFFYWTHAQEGSLLDSKYVRKKKVTDGFAQHYGIQLPHSCKYSRGNRRDGRSTQLRLMEPIMDLVQPHCLHCDDERSQPRTLRLDRCRSCSYQLPRIPHQTDATTHATLSWQNPSSPRRELWSAKLMPRALHVQRPHNINQTIRVQLPTDTAVQTCVLGFSRDQPMMQIVH